MAKKKIKRLTRSLTSEDQARHEKIREQVRKEFPPAKRRSTKQSARVSPPSCGEQESRRG